MVTAKVVVSDKGTMFSMASQSMRLCFLLSIVEYSSVLFYTVQNVCVFDMSVYSVETVNLSDSVIINFLIQCPLPFCFKGTFKKYAIHSAQYNMFMYYVYNEWYDCFSELMFTFKSHIRANVVIVCIIGECLWIFVPLSTFNMLFK